MTDVEFRTYIKNRRAEIEERRRAAAGRLREWAADFDRLEGWLTLSRQRALDADQGRETGEQVSAAAAMELER